MICKITFTLSRFFSLTAFLFLVKLPLVLCSDCVLQEGATNSEKQLLEHLSPLKNTILQVSEFTINGEKYKYTVGICQSVNNSSPDSLIGAVQYDYKRNFTHLLGMLNQVQLVSGTNWILLTYYGGDRYRDQCNNSTRNTKIMLLCDPNIEKENLKLVVEQKGQKPSQCFYMFELATRYACDPAWQDNSIGGGGIFCILFFTVAGLYIVGGFLYQRLIIGAKGLEQIPNYSFWRDFGNLQADGCNFLCRCGPRHESQAYRGIDDCMPKEADDQLLTM